MIKKIVVTAGAASFSARSNDFPNSEFDSLQDWLDFHVANSSWGKPERWVRADAEDISNAIETREIEENGTLITEFKLNAQYSILETDITLEVEASAREARRIAHEAFGKSFIRWLASLNEQSGITPAQVIAMRSDSRIKLANDLANGGDIPTLKYHIETTDWTGLFPEIVKSAALAKITAYLGLES